MSGEITCVSQYYLISAFIAALRPTVPGATNARARVLSLTYALSLSLVRSLTSNAAELCTRALLRFCLLWLCCACLQSDKLRCSLCAASSAFCFVLAILNRKPCAGALNSCACVCVCVCDWAGQSRARGNARHVRSLKRTATSTLTPPATLTADTKFACASNGYAAVEEEQRQR